MKKLTKILSLIVVAVLLVSILCSCALFGRDTAKYRNQVVLTVGDESIKLGKLIDQFNSFYNSYYSYIQQGYMTIEDLFSNTVSSLLMTYAKLDKYKKDASTPTYDSSQNSYVGKGIANMEFLNQTEANFAASYIMYSVFNTLDSFVKNYISAEVGKLGTETKDTSRDFFEYDDFNAYPQAATSYAEYLFHQTMVNETIEEYLDKYYGVDYLNDSISLDYNDYIFADEAAAAAAVENYNKLLKIYVDEQDEELADDYEYPEIDAAQLIDWQEMAVDKYKKTIKNSENLEIEDYLNKQYAEAVISIIVGKYDFKNNSLVESDADFLQNIKQRFAESLNSAKQGYATNPDTFISFVEALTNESYIYDIPAIYSGQYIYVKNLLIPFTNFQKAQLANFEKVVGGTDNDHYKAKLLEFAKNILARDFSVEDEEADDAFVADFFDIVGSDIVLKGQNLSSFFVANSKSGVFNGDASDFVELMKKYNTDVAQHSTMYDYVVRVGDTPDSYTAKWVPEFVEAANEAWNNTDLTNDKHGYSMCVSSFGVHIVYVSGVVEAWSSFDESKIYDTTSNEYKFLKSYYNTVVSTFTSPIVENLEKEYMSKDNPKVAVTAEFDKLLKEIGIEYNFEDSLVED